MEDNNQRRGIYAIHVFFFILFILKVDPGGNLTSQVADWSWWWITAPIWGFILFAMLGHGIIALQTKANQKAAEKRAEEQRAAAWKQFNPDA